MVRHDVRARYVWHISKSDLENNSLEQALEEAMKLGVIMSTLMIVDDFEGALQYGQDLGLEAVEVGVIGIGNDHVAAYQRQSETRKAYPFHDYGHYCRLISAFDSL